MKNNQDYGQNVQIKNFDANFKMCKNKIIYKNQMCKSY